jgi:hypothetical protein
MKRPKDKRNAESFTWEDIFDKIKRCKKLKDLRENYTSEYRAALRNSEWKIKLNQFLPSRKRSSNYQ